MNSCFLKKKNLIKSKQYLQTGKHLQYLHTVQTESSLIYPDVNLQVQHRIKSISTEVKSKIPIVRRDQKENYILWEKMK